MTTFRRYYIDKLLLESDFHGRVLDIGGKKENKKGIFRPPLEKVSSWEYLNIDKTTSPDYHCSADDMPVDDESFDMALMVEVLEHLKNPQAVLAEVSRVLKTGGQIVVTMPFLYPLHSDPSDFQRWTPEKIESEFSNTGLKITQLKSMGGCFAVIYDLLHVSLEAASKNSNAFKNKIIRKFIMPVLAKIFTCLDKHYIYKSKIITTGFYIVATKQCGRIKEVSQNDERIHK